MRKADIPNLLTVLFLVVMFIAGSYQMIQSQQQYGWTYEQTTIIGGISTTSTVDLSGQAISLLFLLWLVFLLLPKKAQEVGVFT